VEAYPLYILDLDGTLFRGNEPIPYAVETVKALRLRGATIRFLTNNSGETREYYFQKLSKMGFHPKMDEIYSSAIGSAAWLKENGIRSAFYVGQPGLATTLRDSGINVVNEFRLQADAVVAGICKSFTYQWLCDAMQQILEGAVFVATNTDSTYPVENGGLIPGAGSLVSAIQTCSGVEPHVIGKPNPYLIELILKESGVPPANALVVGDRMENDILSGDRAGCPTFLVLTGVSKTAPVGQAFAPDMRGLI